LLGGTDQIASLVQGIAKIVAQNRLIRNSINSLPDVARCRHVITLLMASQAEQMQRIGVAGLNLKNTCIEHFCSSKLPGLVQGNRLRFHLLNQGCAHQSGKVRSTVSGVIAKSS
ncbi:MAG: hypothetical protein ABI866_03740, partial [Dokdonella sp.]